MATGRPPKYKTPEALLEKVLAYFEHCKVGEETTWKNKRGEPETDTLPIPPTGEGLVLFLGFVSRASLFDYSKRSPEFSSVLSRARTMLVHRLNEMALRGETDPRYTTRVVAVLDPEYREKMDITATVTGDISSKLAEAFLKAGSAKTPS